MGFEFDFWILGRGQVVHFLESCWFGDGGEGTCGIPSLKGNAESLKEEWRVDQQVKNKDKRQQCSSPHDHEYSNAFLPYFTKETIRDLGESKKEMLKKLSCTDLLFY